MNPRLRSDVQIGALQRRCEGAGLFFTVLHRGHEEGGLIFVKWVSGRKAHLFTERSVGDGRRWVALLAEVPEREANERIASERSFDPDLWAVEGEGPFNRVVELLDPAEGL